jgi:putative membrane-bound dehydrogenase-like protein
MGMNMAIVRFAACLALVVAACFGVAAGDDVVVAPQTYLVGVASLDITPDYPIRLSGFGFRRTESEGVMARIFARALAIGSDTEGPVLLLTVDTTGISDPIVAELAQRLAPLGVKRERIAVTGTHTHTAPMLRGVLPTLFGEPIPPDHQAHIDRYTQELTDHLEQVSRAALADRQPAKLLWGVGELDFAKNRRNPKGPIDHALPVLAVKTSAGKLRAVLATYACHAVTLSHNFIGGDWPGFAAEAIERQHPGVVALISIGCGADQNPTSGVTGDKVDVARGRGAELAAEVTRVLGGALRPIMGTLDAHQERIELPLADLPPRSHWEELVKKGSYIGYHAQVQLAALDRGESLTTKVNYQVTTWNFGESLAMVFLPGEVVVDYALRLKREFDPARVWITAYANDSPCYIPSERVLKEAGYEGATAMTYYNKPNRFAVGIEQRIIDAVHRLVPKAFAVKTQVGLDQPPPLSPQQSLRHLQIPSEWKAQLVAAEPLTTDPVAIDFGVDGALWVCEMHDYPSGLHGNFEPGGRVRILRDDDGDGIFDRSTIFLDGLPFPTGVTVWRKGVLVCAAPDILYAEDTDGDDRADIRRVLFAGFGTENYQARVNSLIYGLDGWVYGACGLFGGDIKSHITGKTTSLGNRDFRIDPDRGLIEPLTGRTQQGRVRTDDGDWFGCSNSQPFLHYPLLTDDSRPGLTAPPLVVNVPQSAERLQLYPRLAEYQRFKLSGPAGRVTAACGLGIYRDDWLGHELAGNPIVCEPVNLLLHRRVLQPQGVTFTAQRAASEEQSELITSTDNWFRPAQVRTGPDGGLWIVDMSRAVIEHPRWIPEEAKAKLDVRAGDDQGRIIRLLPSARGARPLADLSKMTSAELVETLSSPNGTVRDLAQQLLWWRDDRLVAPALDRLAISEAAAPARVAALWVLARWQQLPSDVLKAAITSREPRIRRQAIRLLATHQSDLPDAKALLDLSRDESDPLVTLDLIEALRQIPADNRAERLAKSYRTNLADPYLKFAALRSVPGSEWVLFVAATIADSSLPSSGIESLVSVSLASADSEALRMLLPHVLPKSADVLPRNWGLVEQIAVAWSRNPQQAENWLIGDRKSQLTVALATARRLFAEEATPDKILTQLAGLLGLEASHRAEDVDRLAARLSSQSSPALQTRIVGALDRMRDPQVPRLLLDGWSSLGPAAKSDILDRLLSRPQSAKSLLDAIASDRFSSGWLDATRRQALLQHPDAEVRSLAAKALPATGSTSRAATIAQHQSVVSLTGDLGRGREIYRKRCFACHTLEGEGHAAGPDLGESRNKSWSTLLTSMLDPNQAVDQRYAAYTVLTTDGRSLQGLLTAESESSITLKGQEAKLTILPRSEIEKLASSGRSLMPEALERDLTPQDFADVCALLTHRASSGETPTSSLADIAQHILDDSRPRPEREALIAQQSAQPAELIAALAAGLGSDTKEEYRRIPWIWRVAIAVGKANDAARIKSILQTTLPASQAPLADWQAVVIGGGIVNGISQAGAWPHERIAETIGNDSPLKARWRRLLDQADDMAANPTTPPGTRYDALRMIALDGWSKRGETLSRYLTADANAELQMGAVSGLVDIPDPPATAALLDAIPQLKPRNRELALDGLLRSEARMLALLDAVAAGRIGSEQLGVARQKRLIESPYPAVKQRAESVLSKLQ